jgi:hypothetical protein
MARLSSTSKPANRSAALFPLRSPDPEQISEKLQNLRDLEFQFFKGDRINGAIAPVSRRIRVDPDGASQLIAAFSFFDYPRCPFTKSHCPAGCVFFCSIAHCGKYFSM